MSYWIDMGFQLVMGFIEHSHLVIISNHNTFIGLHALWITTAHYRVFSVCYAFACRCLITAHYILTQYSGTLLRYPTSERRFSAQIQSYITTDGQSASLSWCQAPTWDPQPTFPILSLIIFRQFRVCWCGAPSLTRSRVCNFLMGIVSAVFLRSESHGIHDHILLSLFLRLPPTRSARVLYFRLGTG
jgi:hypothetical protein